MENKITFSTEVLNSLLSIINHSPSTNAYYINEIFYTFQQLGESISKIRKAIKESKEDSTYFGLVTNDDLETYATIFAIWLEGKAYVPLQCNQPLDRCIEIINQINIKTILDSSSVSRFITQKVIKTKQLFYKIDCFDYDNTINDNIDAYVLFTSGTTGRPKGVRISRGNIAAFMDSFKQCGIDINEEDKCLQCFDLAFDVSVQCFLTPLIKGACVYTVPAGQIKYSYVYGLLEEQKLTFGAMTPSMLRYLKPYFDEINLPNLKYCILTGEASPLALVQLWKKCVPNAGIFNFYGPTETTIYCTYCKFNSNDDNKTLNGMLSIGKLMKNVGAIIIDENNNILPCGEKGELCISGNQVSIGYWNQPGKNASAFFEKKYNGVIHRFYRTGDLCYFNADKTLMLYGRIDSQAKIQGFRVELGEIEHHAREHLKGDNAVAITFTNTIGNTAIILFAEGEKTNVQLLSNYLKTKLPYYMIPEIIIIEKKFPLNANGKVDKKKLKQKIAG